MTLPSVVTDWQLQSQLIALAHERDCIGLLPGYISRFDRGPIELPGLFSQPMQRQVWMAVNAESEGSAQVQIIVELIQNTFEERHEWFEQPSAV